MAHFLTEKPKYLNIENTVGKYYLLTASNNNPLRNTNPLSVDRLRLYPIIIRKPAKSSSFAIRVNSTTSNPPALLRWGIWDDYYGFPNKLLFDSGNIDVLTTGIKEVLEDFSFQPGRYWIGANVNNSVPTYICHQEKPTNLVGLDLSQISSQNVQLYLISPFANGLPDNIGNQSFNVNPRDNLAVWYKEA